MSPSTAVVLLASFVQLSVLVRRARQVLGFGATTTKSERDDTTSPL